MQPVRSLDGSEFKLISVLSVKHVVGYMLKPLYETWSYEQETLGTGEMNRWMKLHFESTKWIALQNDSLFQSARNTRTYIQTFMHIHL